MEKVTLRLAMAGKQQNEYLMTKIKHWLKDNDIEYDIDCWSNNQFVDISRNIVFVLADFLFKNKEDAVHFKLVWSDEE